MQKFRSVRKTGRTFDWSSVDVVDDRVFSCSCCFTMVVFSTAVVAKFIKSLKDRLIDSQSDSDSVVNSAVVFS